MKLSSKGAKEVAETRRGVYLWQMPNGSFIADDAGHYLMIEAMEGDNQRMRALQDAAREFGVHEGQPCFFRGNRIVTDEEYEEQKMRFEWGLTPDVWDIASVEEDRRVAHERSRRGR